MSLLTNLVAYYKLDEASGNALDAHGSLDLTDENTVGAATGKINGARDYVRANSERHVIADNAAFDITGDLTITGWVRRTQVAVNDGVVGKWNTSGNQRAYSLNIEGNNGSTAVWRFRVSNNGSTFVTVDSAAGVFADTWYFFCIRHDTTNDVISISIDGGTPATTAFNNTIFNSSAGFTIGQGTGTFMNGLIDEVGVWNRVLTSTEVSDLYNSGAGLSYDSFGGGPTAFPHHYYQQMQAMAG